RASCRAAGLRNRRSTSPWRMPPPVPEVSSGKRVSFALELRLALFQEGDDALGIIGAAAGGSLAIALHVKLFVETVGRSRLNKALCEAKTKCGARSQRYGERPCLIHEIRVLDRLPDQPPFGGPLGRQGLGGHGQRLGAELSDNAGETPCAAGIGYEADPGEGLDELGGFRREHDVT